MRLKPSLHDHMCAIFRSREEQLSTLTQFLLEGFRKNEKCVCILDERTRDEVLSSLAKFDIPRQPSDQLVFLTSEEMYLGNKSFQPDEVIRLIEEMEKQAINEGFRGLRMASDMTWALADVPGVERLTEYEAKLNHFLHQSKTVALCLYSEEMSEADRLVSAILTHPTVVLQDTIHDNPYYLPPHVFLGREVDREVYKRLRDGIVTKKKILDEFRSLRDRYNALLQNTTVGIAVKDERGRIVEWNRAAERLTGLKREDVIGREIWDVIFQLLPEERRSVRAYSTLKKSVQETIASEGKLAGRIEGYEIVLPDGSRRVLDIVGMQVDAGDKKYMVDFLKDITELKRSHERLKEEGNRFRALFENISDPSVIVEFADGEPVIKDVNPAFERVFGYPKSEVTGRKLDEIIVPPERLAEAKELNRIVLSGEFVRAEVCRKTAFGEKYFILTGVPIKAGDRTEAFGIYTDITELKELQEELRRSEEKYRMIFQNTPNIVGIVREDGVIIEANPAMIESLGINPVGKSVYHVLPRDVAERRMNYALKAIKENKRIAFEDSREGRHFINSFVPLELRGDRHCLVISRDITDIKRREMLLKGLIRIGRIIVQEKDRQRLLEKVCMELTSLHEFISARIGLIENGEIVTATSCGQTLPEVDHCEVLNEVVRGGKVVKGRAEKCRNCLAGQWGVKQVLFFPMVVDGVPRGVLILYQGTEAELSIEELELLETISNDIGFAVRNIELEEISRKAVEQIEENIYQFATLIDEIGDPLTALLAMTEATVEDREAAVKMQEQIQKIEEIIERLNRGWLDTERVRKVIMKTWEVRHHVALSKLSGLALSGADLDVLMNEAAELVAQSLEVDYVEILELSPSGRDVLVRAVTGLKDELQVRTFDISSHPLIAQTLKSDEPFIVKDLPTGSFKVPASAQLDFVSGISTVIPGKVKVFGVLGAYTTKKRNFSADDINFLQAVANTLSTAIDRKKAEEEIRRLKEFNEKIVQSMEEGILIEDEDGYITFANPRMLEMLGSSKEELIGKHWSEIFSPDCEGKIREENRRVRNGERVRFNAVLNAGERELHVIVSATPIIENGRYVGNLKVLVDITEIKEAEERLRLKALNYNIERGRSYLILDKTLDRGSDVLRNLIDIGYKAMVISRTPPEEIEKLVGEDVEILWISEKKKGKGIVRPELLLLEKIVEDFMSRNNVVLLDRLDYLILIHGFDEVLKFLTKLNELVYLTKGILLVVIDPDILSERERVRLEKEVKRIEPKYRIKLKEDLFDILRYIQRQNDLGRNPAHKDIMRAFNITRPTATKKLKELKSLGLIIERKIGRYKVLELTDRGKELL